MRLKNLFFSILLITSIISFAYTKLELQIAVGERNQEKVLKIINSLDYQSLPLDFKCEVVLAYTDLYVWGTGNVKIYQDIAKKYVENLLKSFPTYWKCQYAAAMVYGHYVQKNFLLALIYYKKIFEFAENAVKYGPDQYLAHLLVGILNLETPFGNLSKAQYHLFKALELNPNHVYTYVELGKFYERTNNCQKAIEMYSKALKVKGEVIWKYINEEGRQVANERLLEVKKKCTKK
ncbi:hypothetical protein SAMN02745199_1393 [Thermosipho atlanticus DSM 15807]|uniref:Uncharacterized protein n=1 Tax=Thermosipho atlanticus DSM 15807 TaxID=1123380 RepID=A0A1M5TLN8_9BACT|nr:hypothetical protein SAMN02745199_1393 [Thermosipho atlanticus DSM 15807]